MLKKVLMLCVVAVFVFSLSGCATLCKQKDLEIQGLKNQVSVLEAQVQSKDEEITGLKDELSRSAQQGPASGISETGAKPVTKPTVKQIQTALANAGFNPGKIDGVMGKQTREAVKAFQKAHNLIPSGKVKKKTWELLSQYLNQKTK
jgi:peptidoglycan hydrolase-like protein with peptidoglycan-binding domain